VYLSKYATDTLGLSMREICQERILHDGNKAALAVTVDGREYLGQPLNMEDREDHTPRVFRGHLINDVMAPTQPTQIAAYLTAAHERANVRVGTEVQFENGQPFVEVRALREIKPGEELLFYYGVAFWFPGKFTRAAEVAQFYSWAMNRPRRDRRLYAWWPCTDREWEQVSALKK
jgi:hypothetical protein